MAGIRLHVLDLGRLRMPSRVMVGEGLSPFAEIVDVPVSAYCIDHPDGRVLFDAGCHPQAMGPNGRWSQDFQRTYPHIGDEFCTLPHRLEQMGLGPDDFRHVVLSHLHSDHAGCVEFFRKARLLVHADEFAAARRAFAVKDDAAYAWRDMQAWGDLNWHPVQAGAGDRNLHPGIEILNFGPGHAFGMLGMLVDLPEAGRTLLASDALYCAENFAPAPRLPGWIEDRAGYLRTVDRIRSIAGRAPTQIWFGHDPRQFATLRKSTEGWYA